jgi:hypothetical protein
MRCKVLVAVKTSTLVIWVLTLSGFVGRTNVSEEHNASIFRAEYEGSMFLRNVGIYLPTLCYNPEAQKRHQFYMSEKKCMFHKRKYHIYIVYET